MYQSVPDRGTEKLQKLQTVERKRNGIQVHGMVNLVKVNQELTCSQCSHVHKRSQCSQDYFLFLKVIRFKHVFGFNFQFFFKLKLIPRLQELGC